MKKTTKGLNAKDLDKLESILERIGPDRFKQFLRQRERRGRPPLDVTKATKILNVRVTSDMYNRIRTVARRRGVTPSQVVRELLNRLS